MLVTIANVLSRSEVMTCQQELATAQWVDGTTTAGVQSGAVKHNDQLPENSPTAQRLGEAIMTALSRNDTFLSAAVPLRISPPLFNRYQCGQSFGSHVDNAIRRIPGRSIRIRTDLSCTLFLSDPNHYDGGELVIEDHSSDQHVKCAAGSLVLYPSTSLHHVREVTSGERLAAVFWLQSMVRGDHERQQLFALDRSIQSLTMRHGVRDPICVELSNIYHNLMRHWAEI